MSVGYMPVDCRETDGKMYYTLERRRGAERRIPAKARECNKSSTALETGIQRGLRVRFPETGRDQVNPNGTS